MQRRGTRFEEGFNRLKCPEVIIDVIKGRDVRGNAAACLGPISCFISQKLFGSEVGIAEHTREGDKSVGAGKRRHVVTDCDILES